jgi:hypothetical protein
VTTMRTVPSEELTITDRYGDQVKIRKTRRGYQVERDRLTPSLVLTKEVGVIVGQRVKTLRQERGWTLAELCIRADIRSTTPKNRMWEIENSIRREGINTGTIYSLAIALGVEITDLLPSVAEVRDVVAPQTLKQTVVSVKRGVA